MIRPRLRPTVSRRNRYLSIAPRAEKKLYSESRRGSHDLRRLVGHANFLDDLTDSLDPTDVTEEGLGHQNSVSTEEIETADLSLSEDESTASEEDWSDDEDDEDHALVRTTSGRPLVSLAKERLEIQAALADGGDDYFSRPSSGVENGVTTIEEDKIAAEITVDEVASSLSDLADELKFRSLQTVHLETAADEKPTVTDGAAARHQ